MGVAEFLGRWSYWEGDTPGEGTKLYAPSSASGYSPVAAILLWQPSNVFPTAVNTDAPLPFFHLDVICIFYPFVTNQ